MRFDINSYVIKDIYIKAYLKIFSRVLHMYNILQSLLKKTTSAMFKFR